METTYSYSCKGYPGMALCPGSFVAETKEELWRHIELDGSVAHQEDLAAWSLRERRQIEDLIRTG